MDIYDSRNKMLPSFSPTLTSISFSFNARYYGNSNKRVDYQLTFLISYEFY